MIGVILTILGAFGIVFDSYEPELRANKTLAKFIPCPPGCHEDDYKTEEGYVLCKRCESRVPVREYWD